MVRPARRNLRVQPLSMPKRRSHGAIVRHHSHMTSSLRLLPLTCLLAAALSAAEPAVPAVPAPEVPAAPAPKRTADSQWVFSLLPKSFQKNPNLELTVITEMTDEGKKLPPVTPEHPAYYVAESSGYHQLGDPSGEKKTVPQAEVERTLTKALARNGYHPAQLPAQPPTLAVFYTWGSHNILVEGDEENPALSGEQVARNLLDRAALVGGEKFAKELLELFNQADAMNTAASGHIAPGGQSPMTPEMMAFADPIHLFRMRNPKNDFLLDQTADDIYYVVASAYDYPSLAQNQRHLLWRTRMTVAAKGVSQVDTLPTLIATAAPYFGRAMDEAETLIRRTVPEGKVEIGTPREVAPAAPTTKP